MVAPGTSIVVKVKLADPKGDTVLTPSRRPKGMLMTASLALDCAELDAINIVEINISVSESAKRKAKTCDELWCFFIFLVD